MFTYKKFNQWIKYMLPPCSKVSLLIKEINLLFHLSIPKSSVSEFDIYFKKGLKIGSEV